MINYATTRGSIRPGSSLHQAPVVNLRSYLQFGAFPWGRTDLLAEVRRSIWHVGLIKNLCVLHSLDYLNFPAVSLVEHLKALVSDYDPLVFRIRPCVSRAPLLSAPTTQVKSRTNNVSVIPLAGVANGIRGEVNFFAFKPHYSLKNGNGFASSRAVVPPSPKFCRRPIAESDAFISRAQKCFVFK
jgi:hypothetical protein